MSDTTKRDAVLEEFCPQRYRESPWQTIRKLAAEDMADEIVRQRQRAERTEAAIARVRALHAPFLAWVSSKQFWTECCRECWANESDFQHPCSTIRALDGDA